MTTEKKGASVFNFDKAIAMGKKAGIEASKRTAVRQITEKVVQGTTLAIASKTTGPTSEAIVAFTMQHPKVVEGGAKMLIALLAPYIPQIKDHPLLKLFGEECLTQGVEDWQGEAFSKIMEFVVPAITMAFQQVSENPAVRVLVDMEESAEQTADKIVKKEETTSANVLQSMFAHMNASATKEDDYEKEEKVTKAKKAK